MMKRAGIRALAALWIALGATGAQAIDVTAKLCVSADEASRLMLVVAPDAIEAAGMACAKSLPSSALIRQTNGPFLDKFRAEADLAWPKAKLAIGKIAGDDSTAMLDSAFLRPMLSAMLVPEITKAIKPADCATIDHIVTLLAPLPPRNAADLIVTIMQLKSTKQKSSESPVPICAKTGL